MRNKTSIRKFGFLFYIFFAGLITAYILFIAGISIYVGFLHIHRDGSWIPILSGLLATVIFLWLFVYGVVYIRRQMKEKDIIHHI